MWHRVFLHRDVREIKELQDNHPVHRLERKDFKQKMKYLCCTKIKTVQNDYHRTS